MLINLLWAFTTASWSPTRWDKKQKELIALGIAVATHCKPCIYQHTQAAVQDGATSKEILEAAGIAVLMAGGPAFAHLPEILKTFDVLGVKY